MPTAIPPEQRADAWSAVAEAYHRFSQQVTRPFAEDAARLVRMGAGTRVLDVAAGTGNFAFAAARSGARVLATDFAPGMITRLSEEARAEGVAVETAVMDGQALELPDHSFDVVGSIFGLLFFPDPDKGIQEMLRVVVPGGRALISTWAPPPRGEMSRLMGLALAAAVPDAPPVATPPGPPPWARLGDAEALRTRILANGFANAHVVELRHVWVFDELRQFTETMPRAAPQAVAMFATLTSAQRSAFVHAIDDDFRARQGDGPYALTHEALIAVATAPGR
ncbi:MAG TPA: class I SAM-dependent methyltransferase [Gemmatimonadaceae bacterium]|nr:class I SAM-dependent methyltransferase [Gemmatimonadaceae bacterium]